MPMEMSFCTTTSKWELMPVWPLPSSARKTILVAGCRTVMLPVHEPLMKTAGVGGSDGNEGRRAASYHNIVHGKMRPASGIARMDRPARGDEINLGYTEKVKVDQCGSGCA